MVYKLTQQIADDNARAYQALIDTMKRDVPSGITLEQAGEVYNAVTKTMFALNKLGNRLVDIAERYR